MMLVNASDVLTAKIINGRHMAVKYARWHHNFVQEYAVAEPEKEPQS
jgi:hypothetical protein